MCEVSIRVLVPRALLDQRRFPPELTDADAPAAQELYALYVDPELHGSGVASALLNSVIGSNAASLWVLGDNPRAQAFYSREGFVADGASKMLDGELSHIPEIRMVRLAS